MNQKLVVRLLEKWGYLPTLARNGREAYEAAARETFDLVLMDVQMPEWSGLEATEAIREGERPGGKHIPIVRGARGAAGDAGGQKSAEGVAGGDLPSARPANGSMRSWVFGELS